MSQNLKNLKELFPDWKEDDLIATLQEVDDDFDLAVARISEGHAAQWTVSKTKSKKKQEKVKERIVSDSGFRGQPRSRGSGRGSFVRTENREFREHRPARDTKREGSMDRKEKQSQSGQTQPQAVSWAAKVKTKSVEQKVKEETQIEEKPKETEKVSWADDKISWADDAVSDKPASDNWSAAAQASEMSTNLTQAAEKRAEKVHAWDSNWETEEKAIVEEKKKDYNWNERKGVADWSADSAEWTSKQSWNKQKGQSSWDRKNWEKKAWTPPTIVDWPKDKKKWSEKREIIKPAHSPKQVPIDPPVMKTPPGLQQPDHNLALKFGSLSVEDEQKAKEESSVSCFQTIATSPKPPTQEHMNPMMYDPAIASFSRSTAEVPPVPPSGYAMPYGYYGYPFAYGPPPYGQYVNRGQGQRRENSTASPSEPAGYPGYPPYYPVPGAYGGYGAPTEHYDQQYRLNSSPQKTSPKRDNAGSAPNNDASVYGQPPFAPYDPYYASYYPNFPPRYPPGNWRPNQGQ